MPATEDIAVVGLSCRFPGAETLERYWELLASGRSAIGSVPPERWGYPPLLRGPAGDPDHV
nr:beta-ketoacyl synthase N-terminal-like domain-containing protein [Dictyobacter vulcani]